MVSSSVTCLAGYCCFSRCLSGLELNELRQMHLFFFLLLCNLEQSCALVCKSNIQSAKCKYMLFYKNSNYNIACLQDKYYFVYQLQKLMLGWSSQFSVNRRILIIEYLYLYKNLALVPSSPWQTSFIVHFLV